MLRSAVPLCILVSFFFKEIYISFRKTNYSLNILSDMERKGILEPLDEIDMFCLHYCFTHVYIFYNIIYYNNYRMQHFTKMTHSIFKLCPLFQIISNAVDTFREAWNLHAVRTEHYRTPKELYFLGLCELEDKAARQQEYYTELYQVYTL